MAKREGYDWPAIDHGRQESQEQGTLEPSENEWSRRLSGLDEIRSRATQSLGRNQDLIGGAVRSGFCAVTVMVSSLAS